MDSRIRFFTDRGIGSRIVPAGLRAAGWSLATMDERYGPLVSQGIDDATWIRDAATNGEVVVAKDKAIARNALEVDAITYTDARVFVIANADRRAPSNCWHPGAEPTPRACRRPRPRA